MSKTKLILNIFLWSLVIFIIIGPNLLVKHNVKKFKSVTVYSDIQIEDKYDTLFHNVFKDTVMFNSKCNYNIYLTGSYNKYKILTLAAYKSFGITKSLFSQIIIAPSSIKNNFVIIKSEKNNKRTLSSVIKHECTHKYLRDKYGILKNIYYSKIYKWKVEGYCEYIAQESSFGFSRGINFLVQEKTDKSASFDYFKYRLYVQYLMDYEKLTFDEILRKDFDIVELEREIKEKIENKEYIPPTI